MKDLIQNRLAKYEVKTSLDQENALKEIAQEILLYGLSEAKFFEVASFQGGTCLRIVHGLDRFSEDLDFALVRENVNFDLEHYLREACKSFEDFGINFKISGVDKADSAVRSRFIKDESLKKLLHLERSFNASEKIQIKIEVDCSPPSSASFETKFLDFPIDFSLRADDLPSLFAGKCHALLCRPYAKGRDWYDFSWYVTNGVSINLMMLKQALLQGGPWKNQSLDGFGAAWVVEQLDQKINKLDWSQVAKDVQRFLKPEKLKTIELWSSEFFMAKTKKLYSTLSRQI